MLFIFGISPRQRELEFTQYIHCPNCGCNGNLKAFATFESLNVFFVPTIKWKKRYFVTTACCHTTYELDQETGEGIWWGHNVKVDIDKVHQNSRQNYRFTGTQMYRTCPRCHYTVDPEFDYCPKCGGHL